MEVTRSCRNGWERKGFHSLRLICRQRKGAKDEGCYRYGEMGRPVKCGDGDGEVFFVLGITISRPSAHLETKLSHLLLQAFSTWSLLHLHWLHHPFSTIADISSVTSVSPILVSLLYQHHYLSPIIGWAQWRGPLVKWAHHFKAGSFRKTVGWFLSGCKSV